MKYLFKRKALSVFVSVVDIVGRTVFLAVPRKKGPIAVPKHALVVRLDHLGDVLFAAAIPKLLKESLGVSQVSFLTSSLGASLLENNPFVDQVLVCDAPWFSRTQKKGGRTSFGGTLRKLKTMNIDLAFSLRGDARENRLLFSARIPERVGYGVTGGGFFLTRELPYHFEAHEREHTTDLLRAAGIRATTLEPKIYFSEEEERAGKAKWRAWGLEGTSPIGVQLEAGSSSKEWPEGSAWRFLELSAQKLNDRKLVFVGTDTKRSEWVSEFLLKHPHLPWLNLIGKTTARELFYCLKEFAVFVGPDSGPTHIAASFAAPTLFLYSGTNRFEQWRSLEDRAEFLSHPVPCSPCQLTECPVPGHPCMSGIEPERVVNWILEKHRVR